MTSTDDVRAIDVFGRDGLRLRADEFGDPDGPVVVLLHGGGQTRFAWGSTARVLAERGWHVFRVDLRGHGESDWPDDGKPTGPFGLEQTFNFVEIQPYHEFARNLPVPTNLNLLHLNPLRGTSLMAFSPGLVFMAVDNLFGGDGRPAATWPGRRDGAPVLVP